MTEHEIAEMARAKAATAERERIRAILTHPAGQKAPALAKRLALHTDMTADEAVEMLTAAD